jgi:hypothetical protein
MVKNYKTIISILIILATFLAGYVLLHSSKEIMPLDATPKEAILSGTYVCLPHADTTGPQTEECTFGLKTDDGVYYAVNFGQSENAMMQFQSGAHIQAEGFIVIKEALSSDQWAKYNMKGIFTITRMIDPAPATSANGKLNIDVVCQSALAYMTFPDAASAEAFVAECKEGKHPELILYFYRK